MGGFYLIPKNELLILDEKIIIIECRVWWKKLVQLVKFTVKFTVVIFLPPKASVAARVCPESCSEGEKIKI